MMEDKGLKDATPATESPTLSWPGRNRSRLGRDSAPQGRDRRPYASQKPFISGIHIEVGQNTAWEQGEQHFCSEHWNFGNTRAPDHAALLVLAFTAAYFSIISLTGRQTSWQFW